MRTPIAEIEATAETLDPIPGDDMAADPRRAARRHASAEHSHRVDAEQRRPQRSDGGVGGLYDAGRYRLRRLANGSSCAGGPEQADDRRGFVVPMKPAGHRPLLHRTCAAQGGRPAAFDPERRYFHHGADRRTVLSTRFSVRSSAIPPTLPMGVAGFFLLAHAKPHRPPTNPASAQVSAYTFEKPVPMRSSDASNARPSAIPIRYGSLLQN